MLKEVNFLLNRRGVGEFSTTGSIMEELKKEVRYTDNVELIHADFKAACSNAIESIDSRLLLADPRAVDKAKVMTELGFKNAKGVEFLKGNQDLVDQKWTLNYFKNRYPLYRYILSQDVVLLCLKYNLCHGHVSEFIEEIPDRNLMEITNFKIYPDDDIYKTLRGGPRSIVAPRSYFSENASFNTSGRSQHLHTVEDDPIVLHRVKNGYLIVTAWGPEAKLPEVQNSKMN